MHPFPSLDWMEAYADAVAAHPQADSIAAELAGRYRFVVTPSGRLDVPERYDLVVTPPSSFVAEAANAHPADLTITTDYERWRGLLSGETDFVMSFLMRKIKVEGDIGSIRNRLSDAKPLLECLQRVPTDFVY